MLLVLMQAPHAVALMKVEALEAVEVAAISPALSIIVAIEAPSLAPSTAVAMRAPNIAPSTAAAVAPLSIALKRVKVHVTSRRAARRAHVVAASVAREESSARSRCEAAVDLQKALATKANARTLRRVRSLATKKHLTLLVRASLALSQENLALAAKSQNQESQALHAQASLVSLAATRSQRRALVLA